MTFRVAEEEVLLCGVSVSREYTFHRNAPPKRSLNTPQAKLYVVGVSFEECALRSSDEPKTL
jgi:hypothetical protein